MSVFERAWKGELPLWNIFWMFGVLYPFILFFVLGLVGIVTLETMAAPVIVIPQGIYLIWWGLCTWKCAINSNGFWKVIARILVVLTLVGVVFNIGLSLMGGSTEVDPENIQRLQGLIGGDARTVVDLPTVQNAVPRAVPAPKVVRKLTRGTLAPASDVAPAVPSKASGDSGLNGVNDIIKDMKIRLKYKDHCFAYYDADLKKKGRDPLVDQDARNRYMQKCTEHYATEILKKQGNK